jgi:hypothetical protein
MKTLVAFNNDSKTKAKYVGRVKAHAAADEIIQGIYWENGKGCAVGCTVEAASDPHEKMESELGIPRQLAYLEDVIFEGLSNGQAKNFPLRFLRAIKPGADLSKVAAHFMVWQFEDEKLGLKNIQAVKDDSELYGYCEQVVGLYKRIIEDDPPTEKEFYELYLAIAWVRAWAGAGAWAAAWAAAWARAWAWAAADDSCDQTPYWNSMADKLIDLLKAAQAAADKREK